MRILVTGSNGFIGCHLTALLRERGHSVWGLDSDITPVPSWLRKERSVLSGVATANCDITDVDSLAELLSAIAPDVVVHLAAKPGVAGAEVDPASYDAVNVGGVANLIDACCKAEVGRIVHSSSSSVYGQAHGAIAETAELRPIGHYGRTKAMGEDLLEVAAGRRGMDVIVLRPFSVIGSCGRPDMAPWRFADNLINGRPVPIHAGAARDFTSVHDVAAAFVLAVEARISGYHAVNIGAGEPRLAAELAERLASVLGCGCNTQASPLPPYMPVSTHADIGRALALLGWGPRVKFADSVTEFGEWFLKSRRDNA